MSFEAKLPIRCKVEVRTAKDGFVTWHSATVLDVGDLTRLVEYEYLLSDDGSTNLTEWITITPVLDVNFTNNRCLIRPVPPLTVFSVSHLYSSLRYGQCVDVLRDKAWCEGVIFDKGDEGSEERRIFFPDTCHESKIKIEDGMIRITRGWDEVNGIWKERGKWLLIPLVEELGKKWSLTISVKKIWYDIQMKNDFGNPKDWTSPPRHTWIKMVEQVLKEHYGLTSQGFFQRLKCFIKKLNDSISDDSSFVSNSKVSYQKDGVKCTVPQAVEMECSESVCDSNSVLSSIGDEAEMVSVTSSSAAAISCLALPLNPYEFPRLSVNNNEEDSSSSY